jgi:hypothetical protein
MSKYPECSVARIAIYPDCRKKNPGSCPDICQNRAFWQSYISQNAAQNDIFTSVITCFFLQSGQKVAWICVIRKFFIMSVVALYFPSCSVCFLIDTCNGVLETLVSNFFHVVCLLFLVLLTYYLCMPC